MSDIFGERTRDELLARIDRLAPNSKPAWGKLAVTGMLAHCQAPLEVALGDRASKRSFIGFLFGRMAKKKFVNDAPFPRDLPTDPNFLRSNASDFAKERDRLKSLVTRLSNGGPEGLSKAPHPFFGSLSPAEWSVLMSKHLDHHLRQFGV